MCLKCNVTHLRYLYLNSVNLLPRLQVYKSCSTSPVTPFIHPRDQSDAHDILSKGILLRHSSIHASFHPVTPI